MDDDLRFEQDWAYLASLQADQEKAALAAVASLEKAAAAETEKAAAAQEDALQREKADLDLVRAKRLRALSKP